MQRVGMSLERREEQLRCFRMDGWCWRWALWVVPFFRINLRAYVQRVHPPQIKKSDLDFAPSSCLDVLYLYDSICIYPPLWNSHVWNNHVGKQIHFPSHRFCYGKFRGLYMNTYISRGCIYTCMRPDPQKKVAIAICNLILPSPITGDAIFHHSLEWPTADDVAPNVDGKLQMEKSYWIGKMWFVCVLHICWFIHLFIYLLTWFV